MMKKRLITLITACFAVIYWPLTYAADFQWIAETVILNGRIQPGDSEKLLKIFKHIDRPALRIQLNSEGGDINEAVKIGQIVNDLMMGATVLNTQKCASACFYILVSSPDRTVFDGKRIGIHRPYFDPSYFSKLSASDAKKEYQRLNDYVTNYLIDMGVPRDFIDRMYTISSDDVEWISAREFEVKIGNIAPFFEELALSKCGKDYSDEEYAAVSNLPPMSNLRLDFIKNMQKRSMCVTNLSSNERRSFMNRHSLKATNSDKYKDWYDIHFRNDDVIFKVHEIE